MALGLGSIKKKAESKDKKSVDKKSSGNKDADDILKKMDEKSAAGACPFC